MRFIIAVASCSILFFCSCGSSHKTVKQKELNEIVVSSASNQYRSSEPKYWDIVHTNIALAPFQKTNNQYVKEAKGEVAILLHPYCYATDVISLDAKSMEIDSVAMTLPNEKQLNYTYENDKLNIQLDKKYTVSDTLEIYIRYTAKPYAASVGGSSAISEDRGLYYINANYEVPNKPKQIWTQGETQANSHWFPTFDQPNEKFTVTLILTVPDSFQTLSNGEQIKRVRVGNSRTDVWDMKQPIQPYAVMFAIGKFAVVADKEWEGKKINYYVEKEYEPYAKLMFKNTPDMVAYFSKITGVPYPWSKYSQVVVRDYVSGAMENTSASLYGEFMNQNARELEDKDYENIVSHELFHQWFGDYATAESWSNLTLNESFANYGEQLWRKHRYGNVSNDQLAYEDLQQYIQQARHEDPPLVRYYYHSREDMFDRVSYQKGGAILRYMNGLMGDTAFYKAMHLYLTTHAYGNAEASDWRKAVETATGTDWHWFFKQWYYRGGHPKLNVDYRYDDAQKKLFVTVSQTQEDSSYTYLLPLKAMLVYGSDAKEIDWNIEKRKQTFSYDYENGTRPFFIPDAKHWLVGTLQESKKAKDWAAQFNMLKDDYGNKRRCINGGFFEPKDTLAQTVFQQALQDKLPEIRTYALAMLLRMAENKQWQKNFSPTIKMLAINDGNNLVRANAWKLIGAWKITGMKNEMTTAINDASYAVAGAALSALAQTDSVKAYQIAKSILHNDNRAELQDAVWEALAQQGNAEDITVYENEMNKVYGRRKISLSGNVAAYLTRVKDIRSFEKGLQLITQMAASESIKNYRFSIGAAIFGVKEYYKALQQKNKDAFNQSCSTMVEKYAKQLVAQEEDADVAARYKQL
jgi:aminopeptidase N